MARARSPNRDKAFKLWEKSGGTRKLADIAKSLGVSESLVRKWKNQDAWEDTVTLPIANGNVTIEEEKPFHKEPIKKARGAQPGNLNAVGHGAPKGNQNRYVHGLYANPTLDMIPEEELNRLVGMDFQNEETLIIEEIILLTSREKQLLTSLETYQGKAAFLELCRKLQAELTKVQKEKRQYLAELRILQAEKAKLPQESQEIKEQRILESFTEEELRQIIKAGEGAESTDG